MHLLAAKPGGFTDEEGIVNLEQEPGDIVILSAQDTSLGLLADTVDELPQGYPSVRLANLVHLSKPAAYDLYEETVLKHCRVIVVSLLGGAGYWRYGVERLGELVASRNISLVIVPGDDQPDPELASISNCDIETGHAIWRYLREGGKENSRNLFLFIGNKIFGLKSRLNVIPPARSLPFCMIYGKGDTRPTLQQWHNDKDSSRPVALLLFYRSHVQSGNTDAFDDFITILEEIFNVLAVATLSLKNPDCLATIDHLINETDCDVVVNTTSFSQHIEGNSPVSSDPDYASRVFRKNIPVIQAILAGNSREDWGQADQGLRARDIAMNIALPEFDGRIISRAVSFKELHHHSDSTQTDVIRYHLIKDRAGFVAQLAANWAALRRKSNDKKHIALVLANYPARDSRIGNGVGLDTPASTINILQALNQQGYAVDNLPGDGDSLIRLLQANVTNDMDSMPLRRCEQGIELHDYQRYFNALPEKNQYEVEERWGPVERDPSYRNGKIMVAGTHIGETFVGIQPSRGYDVDVIANYHDPDLVPPHNYLAFYFWIRHVYQADAVAHIGKHGNMEWLPGKSVALSEECWPDVVFGPTPHLYPFIVNDPGEGAQAKRRAQAVIIDHLMPPMARAEIYGDLLKLENLVDEYYQALGLDPRREEHLREKILAMVYETNIAREINMDVDTAKDHDTLLGEVDTYLCELKESQIRNGLHRFGQLPDGHNLSETLVALTRLPRGGYKHEAGILHCLCTDLELELEGGEPFDPLRFNASEPWSGNCPGILQAVSNSQWRSEADTRERLEILAQQCMETMLDGKAPDPALVETCSLLEFVQTVVVEAVKQSGRNEIDNFLAALSGQFVPAGPSGAPTRGRLDVLPTGRNFYSVDSRAIPTPNAWELGQASAEKLVLRHLQDHGEYPRQLGLSVWGTSTMRTGGDDIAQALALMGVRPVWAQGSNRVIDVEIVPGFQLGRPRVDVTLRISGFFRDAFPNVARLFDTAVQALADYEEPGDCNVLRQHIEASREALVENGMEPETAKTQSRFRIFGSKPGSYGAGLQGLIDEGVWKDKSDLAQAYVNWSGYSYSRDNFGEAAFMAFESRLGQIDIVVQNQDNREHDLLDSDDYYQFQGGMANAAEFLKGEAPTIYHGDHANPANPVIRTLKEELNRVIRSRVINPKWIKAMREHGYKGAFEMAASVDYLFAYDATTSLIDDYQYESNPHALKDMAERLLEAQQRGLWQDPGEYRDKISETILSIDNSLETSG
jgi:cobaltochelatase CobN